MDLLRYRGGSDIGPGRRTFVQHYWVVLEYKGLVRW